jgi:hypothetical protein
LRATGRIVFRHGDQRRPAATHAEETTMKTHEQVHETVAPSNAARELTAEELDQVAGGLNPQPLPPSGDDLLRFGP